MRLLVAEHGAPRRGEMRERKRVGGGPGRQQKDRDLMLEELGEPALDPLGPAVAAISERGARIRARNGGEDVRRDPRRVVAGEIHAIPFLDRMPWNLCRRGCPAKARGASKRRREPVQRGPAACKSCAMVFWAGAEKTSAAKAEFRDRRTLVFVIRIWQGTLGQYCCPSWRPA